MPSNMYLQCCSVTLAVADRSPPETRVSRLSILSKLTGSRDQFRLNIVVQFLKCICAEPSPRLSDWPLSDEKPPHLLPTQPKVASWKVPQNKVVPVSVQYLEPWILVRLPIHNLTKPAPMSPTKLSRKMHKSTIWHFFYNYGFWWKKVPKKIKISQILTLQIYCILL